MSISPRTRKLLWGNAASRCSYPDCAAIEGAPDDSQSGETVKLEECHIVARKPTAARGNANLTAAERDQYPNLILLCPIHHKIIDEQSDTFTTQELHSMKESHEQRVRESLDSATMQTHTENQRPTVDEQTRTSLIGALDQEAYPRVRAILRTVIISLSEAQPWTTQHPNLLYEIGFALWNEGEPGASIPRTARIQPMLDRIRDEFVGSMRRKIWKHVARMNSSQAVDEFCWVLADLIDKTPDESFLSMINDIVEDLSKNTEKFAASEGMMELGNSLGLARFHQPDDESYQEWIDALVIQVGAVLLDCGGEESVARHLMGNGFAYGRKPKRVRFKKYDTINSASYERALDLIGIKRYA